jgi:hypothetical protein
VGTLDYISNAPVRVGSETTQTFSQGGGWFHSQFLLVALPEVVSSFPYRTSILMFPWLENGDLPQKTHH